VWGIEVKSGRPSRSLRGVAAFRDRHPASGVLVVGTGGIPFEEFFASSPEEWLSSFAG
jgi:hypothetical protein